MKFDGQVGDLGSKTDGKVTYVLAYTGNDLDKLREFVMSKCKMKGLEVIDITDGKEGDLWKVSARVRSPIGIV